MIPGVVAAAPPKKPANQTGPSGNTTAPGGGGADNDGWIEGETTLGGSYGAPINYSSERNRGWRLEARLVAMVTTVGKYPICRFLSPNPDTTISAVARGDASHRFLTNQQWVSPWVTVQPALAATIQVRVQISRESGGVDWNITVHSSTIEYRWVNP